MGGTRGRRIEKEDKLCALKLIQEAQQNGCRKKIACNALKISIRTIQRWELANENALEDKRRGPLSSPQHSLSVEERKKILSISNSEKYTDLPPCQIVPMLADEGVYIASESSFYRVLNKAKQLKHRGKQRVQTHKKPSAYVAFGPNQVWSWDISYLPTIIQGLFFYAYLFVDIFSRKIVGYGVYEAEKALHAIKIIQKACEDENIQRHQLIVHSDNGSPMKASTWSVTLNHLGIGKSFSRPSVSNDNPYSEALFKTMKYCRWYPKKPFATIKEAKCWITTFVQWYNNAHLHSGLNFITPEARHQGLDEKIINKRKIVYKLSQQKNPGRWVKKIRNWDLPKTVHLNP